MCSEEPLRDSKGSSEDHNGRDVRETNHHGNCLRVNKRALCLHQYFVFLKHESTDNTNVEGNQISVIHSTVTVIPFTINYISSSKGKEQEKESSIA